MDKLVSLQEPQVSTSFTKDSFFKQILPRQKCLGLATVSEKKKRLKFQLNGKLKRPKTDLVAKKKIPA